ncbi:MAG TPA: CRTAC1 family protein [Verrucomicrobiae bacterium]
MHFSAAVTNERIVGKSSRRIPIAALAVLQLWTSVFGQLQNTNTAQRYRVVEAGHGGHADRPNAADLMMGGGSKQGPLIPGATAGKRVTNEIKTVLPGTEWADGLIALDPVCETIEAPQPKFAPGNPAKSTKQMAAILERHFNTAHPHSMAFLSDKLADMFQTRATNAVELNEKFRLLFNLAIQQINAARPDSALNTFAAMEKMVAHHGGELDSRTRAELRLRKGIAFFRLGEQENCLASHNEDSCLFPLAYKAFHMLPRGSQGAVAMFSAHLAEYPNDFSTRWLLNLAHMTLGQYPDKVSPQYLIPPERFASEYALPRFPDVSDGLGIDANDLAGGAVIDDFDNDGFYDVMISAWDGKGQLRYFRNNRNGKFIERTSEAGLVGEVGSLNMVQTDFNNDGFLDLWLMRGGWLGKAGRIPSSLLKNNGDGTFEDVTLEAGLFRSRPTMATRWFDFNGDGWLDLFIGNESLDPRDPDPCELFRNNGDGTFTECAQEVGIIIAKFVKGVACGDYNNDGRPDLYLSMRNEAKVLLRNDGPTYEGLKAVGWKFTDVTKRSGPIEDPQLSFGTFFFDYNNDGWEDIICFGYWLSNGVGDVAADYLGLAHGGSNTKLYRNNGNGTFSDVTTEAKLDRIVHTMGHNFGDLDNDGWLDFYCGTGDPDFRTLIPNRMFRNAEGRFFQDVTTTTGTGHIQKGHAVAFADFDDDGQQDVYATFGGAFAGDFARNALYHNPGTTNGWVKLKLVGVKANRQGIGARVKIHLETPNGPRSLHRVLSNGGSFGGNPLRLEVGVGKATGIKSVEILWPGSGTRQTVTGLVMRRSYEITENVSMAKELKLNPVNIKHEAKPKLKFFEATNRSE